jgi:3-methyladenine DNA glycosylase/8-oxoguanine DNA glycosylase
MFAERELDLPARYSLGAVCGGLSRGAYDSTCRVAAGELWRAANTPDGPVTLHVRAARDRAVARAWGDGAAWTIERVDALLGLRDEPAVLVTDDPLVARWQRAAPALRLGATHAVHDVALRTVIEQRVTGVEARRTWTALVRHYGAAAPGPGPALVVPPPPETVAGLSDAECRALGLEARRAGALIGVARAASRLQRAADAGAATFDRVLRAISGIGAWTSATLRDHVLGDPDAVIVGDWHVARKVVFAFTRERGGDDARMLALLEPFAGQRGRVARLALTAGASMPRRTPRAEIADIARRDARGAPFRLTRSLRFA